MINAPIPGMSLTGEPKKYPWERPPELVAPEDVADYYIEKISNKETMQALLDTLMSQELTLVELVEGLMRIGVSNGIHTIDAGLIVSPLVHKTIKLIADTVGIDYEEGLVDKKAKEKTEKLRARLLTKKSLEKMAKESKSVKEDVAPTGKEEEDMASMEEPPQGLIPRRTK